MLRQEDLQDKIVDETALPGIDPAFLIGPFGHIIVDEAQELTDAEWQMLLRRCPSGSMTIVGDHAQARHRFPETWSERLRRVGLRTIDLRTLSVNYRTPQEIMAEAAPVIRREVPDANVPDSIRSSGIPVIYGARRDLEEILGTWLHTHQDGIACVIGDQLFTATRRVRSMTPEQAKGLEFDLVILIDPKTPGNTVEEAVDRYVAMTRATQQLVILSSS